jgi:hypothetical protein
MAQPFVIDGICHPYNFSEENLRGRFGRIFNDVLYAFHPLLTPPETALSNAMFRAMKGQGLQRAASGNG